MFESSKNSPPTRSCPDADVREDPREDKIDLGVGVYKNAEGVTPVMRAVKAAEKRWWEEETTKAYTGLAGDPAFADAMVDLVLGDAVPRDRSRRRPRRAAPAPCGRRSS
jgi:aspartate aminotransferase